jgi:hypothetical protein
VLCLSTRWGFTSIRKLALSSIKPATPHDRLLLARKYSVDDWVIPALSAMCERLAPLTLSEARQMDIEDVVLVSTVREDIRSRTLKVDPAEIPRRVETSILAGRGQKEEDAHESDGERSVSPSPFWRVRQDDRVDQSLQKGEEAPGTADIRKGNQAQFINHGREEVAATHTAEKGAATKIADNMVVKLADELAAKLRTEGAATRKKVDMHEVEEVARRMAEEALVNMAEEAARRMEEEAARRREEKIARRKERKAARRLVLANI